MSGSAPATEQIASGSAAAVDTTRDATRDPIHDARHDATRGAQLAGRDVAHALILLLALGARLVAFHYADGFVWEDEFFQSLEPGHLLAFGHGALSWEWETGLRTWLIPYGYSALFRLATTVHETSSGQLVALARLLHVGLSLLIVEAAFRIGRALGGRSQALLAGLLAALSPTLLFYAPRTLLDCPSAAFLAFGYARFLEARARPDATGDRMAHTEHGLACFEVGLWFGLSYLFRYSAPLFFIGPGLDLLARRRPRAVLALAIGFLTVAALVGLFDWPTWGAPFHSAREYLRFNLLEGKSASFGVAPRAFYLTTLIDRLGVAALLSLSLAILGGQGTGGVGWGLLLAFAAMSRVPHKEERFLLPILVMLPPLVVHGASSVALAWPRHRRRVRAAVVAGLLIVVTGSSAAALSTVNWRPHGDWLDAMRYAGRQRDLQGMLVSESWLELGGSVLHQREVPVVKIDPVAHAAEARELLGNEILNYWLVDRKNLAALQQLTGPQSFEVRARFGEVSVLRRRNGALALR